MFSNPLSESYNSNKLQGKLLPGIVVNNNDPQQLYKIQVRISTLHNNIMDTDLPWSMPCTFTPQGCAPGIGGCSIPVTGSRVMIFEAEDDDNHGYYIGDYTDMNCKISEFLTDYPNCYGHADASGNLFIVNTQTNTLLLVQGATGMNILIDNGGGLNIYSPTAIKMKAPTILLDGDVAMGSSVNSGLMAIMRARPANTTFNNQTSY